MKNSIIIVFLFLSTQAFSQNGNTYEIETLTKPENFVYQTTPKNIFRYLKADLKKAFLITL